MTEDVTELFQQYRLCLREIWNTRYWQNTDLRNWDSVARFNRLKPSIFQAIVIEGLSESCGCEASKIIDGFQVVPDVPDNRGHHLATNVVVTTTENGGRNWIATLDQLASSDVTLRFIDIFDWSMMGYVDLRYYVAEIADFPARPDLHGKEALIDVYQARVFWTSDQAHSPRSGIISGC